MLQTSPVPGTASDPGATVTGRALSLLGAFDDEHRRLGLTVLARRAGLPLSTAHRLVGELVTWGALHRTPDGDYVVGRRLWDVGLLAPHNAGLVELASPYLHDLFAATRATVHLAVRDDTQVLYLDRLRGSHSVPILSTVGSRLPMHATAVGKVLLAHAPTAVLEEVLTSLTPITPHTVVRPDLLRRQLSAVRREGHTTAVEEMSLGAASSAVPIRQGCEVVASLGMVVPTPARYRSRTVAALRVAAAGIERQLAARG